MINSTSSLSAPKLTGTYHITAPTGVQNSFSSTATVSASKFTGTYAVSANITPSSTVSSVGLLPTYNLQDTVALPSGASISETKLANSGRFALVDTGNDDTIVYDHTSYTYGTSPTTVTDAMSSVDMSNNGNILVGVETVSYTHLTLPTIYSV